MATHNLIYNIFWIILHLIRRVDLNKMSRFNKPIYNNTYGVILFLCLRQTHQKIYIDVFLLPSRDFDFLKQTTWILVFVFHVFAIFTICNKLRYVLLQTFQPKHFPKIKIHLCLTLMDGVTVPKSFVKDSDHQAINIWNTQPSLLPQHTIPPNKNDILSLPRTDSFN